MRWLPATPTPIEGGRPICLWGYVLLAPAARNIIAGNGTGKGSALDLPRRLAFGGVRSPRVCATREPGELATRR